MDISNPAKPRIRASLPLANSLLGPPTNLQITPDAKQAALQALHRGQYWGDDPQIM